MSSTPSTAASSTLAESTRSGTLNNPLSRANKALTNAAQRTALRSSSIGISQSSLFSEGFSSFSASPLTLPSIFDACTSTDPSLSVFDAPIPGFAIDQSSFRRELPTPLTMPSLVVDTPSPSVPSSSSSQPAGTSIVDAVSLSSEHAGKLSLVDVFSSQSERTFQPAGTLDLPFSSGPADDEEFDPFELPESCPAPVQSLPVLLPLPQVPPAIVSTSVDSASPIPPPSSSSAIGTESSFSTDPSSHMTSSHSNVPKNFGIAVPVDCPTTPIARPSPSTPSNPVDSQPSATPTPSAPTTKMSRFRLDRVLSICTLALGIILGILGIVFGNMLFLGLGSIATILGGTMLLCCGKC